jgi:hypothetical protein
MFLFAQIRLVSKIYIQNCLDHRPRLLNVMGHLRPAFVAQVSEWPLWLALAADVLEVDLNSELIGEVGVFTHGVRVHHCFGQYQYTIEYYRSLLLFLNERRV